MNRAELITLLQVSRGLRIAGCRVLNGHVQTEEGARRRTRSEHRTFTPDSEYGKTYYYKIPAGLHVEQGDVVVLPVRDNELVLGRIVEIHTSVPDDLDLSGLNYNLSYVLDVIRTGMYDIAVAEEHAAMTQIRDAEIHQKLIEFQKTSGLRLDAVELPSLTKPQENVDAEAADDTSITD